MTDIDIL